MRNALFHWVREGFRTVVTVFVVFFIALMLALLILPNSDSFTHEGTAVYAAEGEVTVIEQVKIFSSGNDEFRERIINKWLREEKPQITRVLQSGGGGSSYHHLTIFYQTME